MSTLFVAFEDFILSREAMFCSPETIDFYCLGEKEKLREYEGEEPVLEGRAGATSNYCLLG